MNRIAQETRIVGFASRALEVFCYRFGMFKPMHEMWNNYVTQLLKSVGKGQTPPCLLGADLHGAYILEKTMRESSIGKERVPKADA
nr:ribonuclease P protein subunit p29 [Tanacetum cinerariifolium]